MDEPTLHTLLVRGMRGDDRSYSDFLDKIASALRTYFRRRLFDGGDHAEDLVQDVLIAIHNKRATYDASRPVTAWVYAIARFKLIDHLRCCKRRGVQVDIDSIGGFVASTDAEQGVTTYDLDRLLSELPAKQRRVIRLVKLEECSVSEAARRISISESDVKVSVHRGIKALTRKVAKEA